MNTFLFFRYVIQTVFFSYLVKEYKYGKQSTNTANIVLLPANQIVDIFSCKRQSLIFAFLNRLSKLSTNNKA